MSAVWDTDYLWREVQGAKLASLFGLDRAECQGNESFQFTAPKQPKKTSGVLGLPPQKHPPPPPPCAPAVLFATAAHAFCFVNGQYVKQGKIGAAVLGNHVTKEYKILLYGSKQKQITAARIQRGFVLTVQPCKYVAFYDDQQQNWSLMFDSEKARPEFIREVFLARWNSEASSDSLLTQDLLHGEGQAVNVGDTVEVAYSGWLLHNHSLGQILDSNLGKEKLQRVKLGSGKALRGLEDGMLGMQKGGRRLLIIPPSMSYGSKSGPNHVPAESTLVYDVEVHRVKFGKNRHGGGSAEAFSTPPDVCSGTLSEGKLDTLETDKLKCVQHDLDQAPDGKVEPKSECQIASAPSKAKLISRIAKMGQPMLPFLIGAIPAQPDPSDSETEDANESGLTCDPCPSHDSPFPKPAQIPCTSPSSSYKADDVQNKEEVPQAESNAAQDFQPCSCRENPYFPPQLNSFTSIYPSQHIPYSTPDITSFLMSDARQHNKEILMAIEKLEHRVDRLTSKVDDLHKEGHFSFGLATVSLETNMILYNIQRIIQQESVCLKNEVLSSKLEEQNHKREDLCEQNKRYMEQQAIQTCHIHSEQQKDDSLISSCHLQQELVNHQQRETEIQTQLSAALNDKHKHCAQISLLEAQVAELLKRGEQSDQLWRAEKQKCKELETTIQNMDEEMQDLRAEKENLEQVLLEKKRKWKDERERIIVEQEEEHERSQQEVLQLLMQLRKARHSTEALMKQAEFELSSQKKCDAELAEQKKLEGAITELQEQYEDLTATPSSKNKQFDAQLAVQVKRVMKEVFQCLRTEFDLQESYRGHSVLQILQNTIKSVSMKLLSESWEFESDEDKAKEAYGSTEELLMLKDNNELEEKGEH
ncbi:FK506-binding protein 15 [Danio aesculapii]|uniref:FK506-binding protein 15 n=1 Tax=Danio aesculapii TaxID=1142201 RepID=UPI0024BFE538|nr:FK506-binding protein 15 [Danio aesculapii]